jgi:hypothetical protein
VKESSNATPLQSAGIRASISGETHLFATRFLPVFSE